LTTPKDSKQLEWVSNIQSTESEVNLNLKLGSAGVELKVKFSLAKTKNE